MQNLKLEQKIKKLITAIIEAFSMKPETFETKVIEGDKTVVVSITGKDKTETGILIGKRGTVANAIRQLLKKIGMRYKKHVYLEINDK